MINLDNFCRHFYASRYLPIAYYAHGVPQHSAGFPDHAPLYQPAIPVLLSQRQNPAVCTLADTGIYGMVRLESTGGYFFLGPAYSGVISEDIIRTYMTLNAVKKEKKPEISQFLSAVPHYTYNRFLNLLVFLNLILNGKEVSITESFTISAQATEREVAMRHAKETYLAREEQKQHGTYFFEQQMLEYVRSGDVSGMRRFLERTAAGYPLTEGKLADHPLRQAKNIFIGNVTMIGKAGAIPGGMDIEQAYQLIDTYIQECERIQSVDAIMTLQYNMIIDFTNRVAQAKMPAGISNEIFACMQYIRVHLNEAVSVQNIADYIGKSRAYTTARFKQETGKTINQYITACRMQEAKTLLQYTGKSIAEISDYLHFSSQPYFQDVFKKYYGISPARFRMEQGAK